MFCSQDGEPYGDIKKSFLSVVNKSCIIDFHFHDLRHTFASQLVMSGVDLNTVRDLLGYESLEVTFRYSRLSPDHKQRAVDTLARRMDTLWSLEQNGAEADKIAVSEVFDNQLVVEIRAISSILE
ncbi:MAG: tyrosine-type recombinase/integrase [Candidatus Omnitrophota bacterium]